MRGDSVAQPAGLYGYSSEPVNLFRHGRHDRERGIGVVPKLTSAPHRFGPEPLVLSRFAHAPRLPRAAEGDQDRMDGLPHIYEVSALLLDLPFERNRHAADFGRARQFEFKGLFDLVPAVEPDLPRHP